MDENTRYVYDPIQDDQLRLIRFIRDETPTAAVLQVFSIGTSCPQYNALSYTWISDRTGLAKKDAFQIENGKLPILSSVQSFIQILRSKGIILDGTWWWIDSICIDQQNLEERSQQVRLMQQIYRNAHKCIIWLGEKSNDSDDAIEFIRTLNKINLQGHSDEGIRPILEKYQDQSQWTALKNFFLRKWWTRVWTIQEFVIPPSVSFWCGTQSISRTVVCRAVWTADKCPSSGFKETIGYRYGFNRRRLWMLYKIGNKLGNDISLSLPALAAYFSINEATDDRDRLYGLRALSTDGFLLDVNYTYGVEDTYLRYTQSFIAHHKSLDIICFASLYGTSFSTILPSWVPDWRKEMEPLVIPLMVSQSSRSHVGNMRPPLSLEYREAPVSYSASKDREAEYIFEGPTIYARGAMVDTIDGLSGSRNFSLVQSSHPNNIQSSRCSSHTYSPIEILCSVCKSLVLDRKDRYLRYAMPVEEFFEDFLRLCHFQVAESKHPTTEEFQEWFNWTRPLQIRGHSFENIVRDSNQNEISSSSRPPNQAEFIHDSFFGRFFDTVIRMSLRVIVTCDGNIGLVPGKAMKGDIICVLFGCSVPVILRKSENMGCFISIGECFLDGYMEGAGLEQGHSSERTFHIL